MDMVSPNEVADGGLPANATGVYWIDTEWFECRKHLEDPNWTRPVGPPAPAIDRSQRVGMVVYWNTFICTSCETEKR